MVEIIYLHTIFFFLGFNWSWKIAWHIISHEIKGEKKYGINTTGSDELKSTAAAGVDISHATLYMPANYLLLQEVFSQLPAVSRGHFLDVGCGKGRVLCVAAHNKFNKVTGIDFSAKLCKIALENLQHTKTKFPALEFAIISQDAALVEIEGSTDCIFFFNPFDQYIMAAVAKNIQLSYRKNPREMHVIYLNPLYKKEFENIGFREVYHTRRMKYMEAVIMHIPARG